ncbi:MAG: extracellular solute-binding protein [Spirochaetes bacterium]|nr:extracellular solute-binding protein [Spirochaetota bacterium]
MFIKKTVIIIPLIICFILPVPRFSFSDDKKDFVIVIRMMEMQDRWFRENIIRSFEKKHNVNIKVVSFDKFGDLEIMLKLDRDNNQHKTGLVKTPLQMTRPLLDYMMPYDDILNRDALNKLKSSFNTAAVKPGIINNKFYYVPRKLETRIMVYLKSKVDDAVNGWKKFEDDINAALKEDNGYGLPKGFKLESDPDKWDYYDIFVVAYYWANTPYYGIKIPRMAHRGKKYEGTVAGLIDRIFQMGGSSADVLRMSSAPVVDMFLWEAVYKKNGLYNPGMWQDPWTGGGIWNAMKDGKVFLAMMHQIDSFFIHGGTHPMMQGYLADPDDMGAAVMPKGVSFKLNSKGKPLRAGTKRAGTAGWWWGIPETAPYPELSAELAVWITNYENHLSECKVFGMMPVRKDISADLKKIFPDNWMSDIFKVSIEQIRINRNLTVPLIPEYSALGKIYLDAWYAIVVNEAYGRNNPVHEKYIRERLKNDYMNKVSQIIKK